MAQLKFELNDGLKVGEETLTSVVMRDFIAGDIISATEESEKVVYVSVAKNKTEPTLVTSPSLMGINVLRRQIVSIGNLCGPIDLEQLKSLSARDLDLLQEKSEVLETASVTASEAVTQKGRTDNPGETA